MKRLLVIAALLGVMLLLERFHTDGSLAGQPMTLAAIGFVVLAAFATAELGNALSLPRVTGYILAGVALGPSVGNILSGQVVTEMRMFNTLALGLIATSAGLELDLGQIRQLGRTLSATILLKVVLGVSLVSGVLYAIAGVLDVGLGPDEVGNRAAVIALAIVMGVLSIGTSPSITLAVLSETKAKGRLTDLVLGAAVFKDLVVVVSLAIAIAISKTLLIPNTRLDSSVLAHVSMDLGGSLAAGTLLGGILIAYVRFVKAEMLLFVAAMILVVAELCRVLHLELLLVFITAGFVVRNFSKYEHDLMSPLELVAMPVFVVFFTNAGAGVDLKGTWQILPAAAALCGARAVAYYFASRWGSKLGKESDVVVNNAWLAYLPQAGVTLGLVGLAGQQLPALGGAIATTGMAVVAINLLLGPITLRRALQTAGEIPDAPRPEPSPKQTLPSARTSAAPAAPGVTLAPELQSIVARLRQATQRTLDEYHESVLPALRALPASKGEPGFDEFESFVARHRAVCRELFEELRGLLRNVPQQLRVELSPEDWKTRPGDGRGARIRSSWRRVLGAWLPGMRRRRVDARLAARMTLEPAFARVVRAAFETSVYHPVPSPADEAARGRALRDEEQKLEGGFAAFERLLSEIGTPRFPARSVRFSAVEPEITAAVAPLLTPDDTHWAERAQAAWGSTLSKGYLGEVEAQVAAIVEQHVIAPCRSAGEKVPGALQALRSHLTRLAERLAAGEVVDDVDDGLPRTEALPVRPAAGATPMPLSSRPGAPLGAESAAVRTAPTGTGVDAWQASTDLLRRQLLDDVSREFRATAAVRGVMQELKLVVSDLPQQMRCLQLTRDGTTADASIRRVELRAMAERHLVRSLVPLVDQAARAASNLFARFPSRVERAVQPSWDALRLARQRLTDEEFRHRAQEELELAVHRLSLAERRLERQLEQMLGEIPVALQDANKALADGVQLRSSDQGTRIRRFERLRERLHSAATAALTWARHFHPDPLRDASDMRQALEEWHGSALPENLERWFSQASVADERVFTAHQDLLEAIVDEEVSWSAGRPSALLLKGPLGSGKSSLLNISSLELRNSRVLRLDGLDREQPGLFCQALAANLGCEDNPASLRRCLDELRPAIVVDNLQAWVARASRPAAELGQLLLLLAQTRGSAFWLVAVDGTAFPVLEEIGEVAEGFSRVLDCGRVGAPDLRQAIEARCAQAGVNLRYRNTLVGEALRRLGLSSETDFFFRRLAAISHGNLGSALSAFVRVASVTHDGLLLDTRKLQARPPKLAPILTTPQLALLHVVTRLDSADFERLHHELALPYEQLERHLAFLNSAGLIGFVGDALSVRVPDEARWAVLPELERVGALSLGGPSR